MPISALLFYIYLKQIKFEKKWITTSATKTENTRTVTVLTSPHRWTLSSKDAHHQLLSNSNQPMLVLSGPAFHPSDVSLVSLFSASCTFSLSYPSSSISSRDKQSMRPMLLMTNKSLPIWALMSSVSTKNLPQDSKAQVDLKMLTINLLEKLPNSKLDNSENNFRRTNTILHI